MSYAYDLEAWNLPISFLDTIEQLDNKPEGIYQVKIAQEQCLDICFQGFVEQECPIVLVGLNGAVAQRNGKKAPFFSGLGIAESLGCPIVSISDPTLAMDSDISIGWYAGNEHIPDLPFKIAEILDAIGKRYNVRLIIFGGSAAGFAGLALASYLKSNATIIAWNPQTSIEGYVKEYVVKYLKTALPHETYTDDMSKDELISIFEKYKIVHNVQNLSVNQNIELLYLQNRSDWHLTHHFKPWLLKNRDYWISKNNGVFVNEKNNTTLFLGDWGEGHAAVPTDILKNIILKIMDGVSAYESLESFEPKALNDADIVSWFDTRSFDFDVMITLFKDLATARCVLRSDNDEHFKDLEYAFYLIADGVRESVHWYTKSPEIKFADLKPGTVYHIIAFAKDRYENKIMKESAKFVVGPKK